MNLDRGRRFVDGPNQKIGELEDTPSDFMIYFRAPNHISEGEFTVQCFEYLQSDGH